MSAETSTRYGIDCTPDYTEEKVSTLKTLIAVKHETCIGNWTRAQPQQLLFRKSLVDVSQCMDR